MPRRLAHAAAPASIAFSGGLECLLGTGVCKCDTLCQFALAPLRAVRAILRPCVLKQIVRRVHSKLQCHIGQILLIFLQRRHLRLLDLSVRVRDHLSGCDADRPSAIVASLPVPIAAAGNASAGAGRRVC